MNVLGGELDLAASHKREFAQYDLSVEIGFEEKIEKLRRVLSFKEAAKVASVERKGRDVVDGLFERHVVGVGGRARAYGAPGG